MQLRKLILSGELPCSKEEAATLAVIQLRIEETSPQSKENEIRHTLPSSSLRQNSIIEEKLRPICEDVKVCALCYIQLSVRKTIKSLTNESTLVRCSVPLAHSHAPSNLDVMGARESLNCSRHFGDHLVKLCSSLCSPLSPCEWGVDPLQMGTLSNVSNIMLLYSTVPPFNAVRSILFVS